MSRSFCLPEGRDVKPTTADSGSDSFVYQEGFDDSSDIFKGEKCSIVCHRSSS